MITTCCYLLYIHDLLILISLSLYKVVVAMSYEPQVYFSATN